jgi:alanine-glyoxylate transaminase/(R)-3-amino-2-methylpropionate-pyruvate transaminase
MTTRETIHQDQKDFLFPCVANYYEEPIIAASAHGSYLKDISGAEYLDFFGGILTVSMAHCEPSISESIMNQVQKLGHTSTLYQSQNQINVAKMLAKLTPGKLKKSFFTNSGTEADETAVMLAKIYTGRDEIIVLRHGYSGRSELATNLTGHASWRLRSSSIAGIKHAHAPYCYRCPFNASPTSCGLECARDIEDIIQTSTSGKIAGFLAEPIMGVGGFITPPDDYFKVAVGIIRNYGGVFICDEVQTGFGRTGDKWFGIEHSGVDPEIMTMAKGIANGLPVGATIATDEVASAFKGASICTFGGNPISMAAAEATISLMEEKNIPARSAKLGNIMREHLVALQKDFPLIGDVRGKGLMQALELVLDPKTKTPAPKKTLELLEATKAAGLLIGKGGLYGNVIRIAPPMLISEDELIQGLKLLRRAFERI